MPHDYRPLILIVNDDIASLLALSTLLEQWSVDKCYDVATARSGEEALRQVLQHEFAVILMDVNMPVMDGFETAQAIQSHPRSADVPIIFVTAYQIDEVSRLRAYQYRAADFLFTPVVPQVLKAKISVFVALAMKNEELRAQTEKLARQTEELTAQNAKLEAAKLDRQAAERQNEAKDEFLAMLSHELRNPLSAITTAAALLGTENLSPEVSTRVTTVIQRQTRQLSGIVDEILDLSRLTSGKVTLSRALVDLASIVRKCVDTISTTGGMANHTVTFDLASGMVDADEARIAQVAEHLIDNALRYTPAGGRVHISTRPGTDNIVLTVRDTGIGLAPELLSQVFGVFVQGARELHRTAGGLGIGLSVVQALVELHGGYVTAHSEGAGLGSTFEVSLPRCSPPMARQGVDADSLT